MKFIHATKSTNTPFIGEYRYKSGFLFFPKRIKDETRWLEFAKWKEEYQQSIITGKQYKYNWIGISFELYKYREEAKYRPYQSYTECHNNTFNEKNIRDDELFSYDDYEKD